VLVSAVGIVVEQFDAGCERGRGLAVSDGFGADEIAPEFSTEMRSVEAAKNTMPVGVIALGAEEQVACLYKFVGSLCV